MRIAQGVHRSRASNAYARSAAAAVQDFYASAQGSMRLNL
jgi:hypothetical protein